MREIKFRAFVEKNIIEREPARVYAVIEYKWGIDRNQDRVTLLLPSDIKWYEIETKWCKVMQYTGLKDKNGKEIYEGDIVIGWGGTKYQVIWQTDGYAGLDYTQREHGSYDAYIPLSEIGQVGMGNQFTNDLVEVIGNIYEHSYLLDTNMRILN